MDKNTCPPNSNLQIKSVVNMSSAEINPATISVLEKGLNFAVAHTKIPINDIICNIENTVSRLPKDTAELIRQESAAMLRRSKPPRSNISLTEMKALKELRQRDDIQILKADKGNSTVIMDKQVYIEKMNCLLNTNTYKKLKNDPTKLLLELTKSIAKQCGMNTLSDRSLIPMYPQIPRIYGLPKIHKKDVLLRPIYLYQKFSDLQPSKIFNQKTRWNQE